MRASKAKRMRSLIEALADHLADTEAIQAPELFRVWSSQTEYRGDQRVQYQGELYRCLQDHTAQSGWEPAAAPSLWARVLIEDPGVIVQWVQPDSTNPYRTGDRVIHNGRVWVSLCDNNVWEPGVYGWEALT